MDENQKQEEFSVSYTACVIYNIAFIMAIHIEKRFKNYFLPRKYTENDLHLMTEQIEDFKHRELSQKIYKRKTQRVKNKIIAVTIVNIILTFHNYFFECSSDKNILQCLYIPTNVSEYFIEIGWSLIANTLLFLGPLYQLYQEHQIKKKRKEEFMYDEEQQYNKWLFFKRCIAAPIIEEWLFRGLFHNVYDPNYTSNKSFIFLSTLFFSFSHLNNLPKNIQYHDIIPGILITAFQILFTYVFAIYSAFIFIRSKTIVASIVVHAYCNYIGAPNFSELKRQGSKLVLLYVTGVAMFTVWCLIF